MTFFKLATNATLVAIIGILLTWCTLHYTGKRRRTIGAHREDENCEVMFWASVIDSHGTVLRQVPISGRAGLEYGYLGPRRA